MNITDTIKDIEKKHGRGIAMRYGDNPLPDIDVVHTGSVGLDIILGGGLPKGRIVEILGPESSGKTTAALHIISEVQKTGKVGAIIDAEHALDVNYANAIGVNTEELVISQPDTGEQALSIAEELIKSEDVGVVVIDSVAALVPLAELQGEMGDSHMGLQARLMSQAMRKLTGVIARSNTILLFINQIRMKLATMPGTNPETTSGGNALKFYSSVRLDIRRIGQIKKDEMVIGGRTRIKTIKNKVAPPFKMTEFDIIYGEGINKLGEIVDLGVQHGIIEKSGSWYSYGGDRIGQGREAVKEFLLQNPETSATIEQRLRKGE